MVYDFSVKCKSYDASSYKKADFTETRCPKCRSVGRFNLHGTYRRHVVYPLKEKLVCKHIEIKRIKCLSCKTTHAVMPGDIIPYKLLSLLVIMFLLTLFYLHKEPVLKIAGTWGFSFQFIYTVLMMFRKFALSIYLYFREAEGGAIPLENDETSIFALIRKPYTAFQSGYIRWRKRPCFMCKFFDGTGAPPIGHMTVR